MKIGALGTDPDLEPDHEPDLPSEDGGGEEGKACCCGT
jgi:hypothetical protein